MGEGLWVPWPPQALPNVWPHALKVAVVLDHFSRAVVGYRVLRQEPGTEEIVRLLDACRRAVGATPKYVVTDSGVQFQDGFRLECEAREIQHRRGAVGQSGSIAVLERFFRSLKEECLRKLAIVPVHPVDLAAEVGAYAEWYNRHRPHQGLGGRTPAEVRDGMHPAEPVRLEPRARYPIAAEDVECRRVRRLPLRVEPLRGRGHLPVVDLRDAA